MTYFCTGQDVYVYLICLSSNSSAAEEEGKDTDKSAFFSTLLKLCQPCAQVCPENIKTCKNTKMVIKRCKYKGLHILKKG